MTFAAADRYLCICNSLIRFIEDFRKAENPAATFFDWDAHATIADLPQNDVMGPGGIGLANENQTEQVVFSFGLATVNDTNLFRLRALVSKLYGKLQPEMTIPIYDTAGNRSSWLVIKNPVTIAPVSRSEVRSIQFISSLALVDPLATSSL